MNNKQNIDIEAIKTRANAATQGPWTQREIQDYSEIAIAGHSAIEQPLALVGSNGDADFIAHAPEDVAALLAEVERLTAELDTTNKRYNELNRYNISCTKQCDNLQAEKMALKEQLIAITAERDAGKARADKAETERNAMLYDSIPRVCATCRNRHWGWNDVCVQCKYCDCVPEGFRKRNGDFWAWRGAGKENT